MWLEFLNQHFGSILSCWGCYFAYRSLPQREGGKNLALSDKYSLDYCMIFSLGFQHPESGHRSAALHLPGLHLVLTIAAFALHPDYLSALLVGIQESNQPSSCKRVPEDPLYRRRLLGKAMPRSFKLPQPEWKFIGWTISSSFTCIYMISFKFTFDGLCITLLHNNVRALPVLCLLCAAESLDLNKDTWTMDLYIFTSIFLSLSIFYQPIHRTPVVHRLYSAVSLETRSSIRLSIVHTKVLQIDIQININMLKYQRDIFLIVYKMKRGMEQILPRYIPL